ncbi:hypothetical protein T45_05130 [Streptomyces turgidiscabies]|nr:hypothetical protein T45_05130 [Streptomyces turgidiscabies]
MMGSKQVIRRLGTLDDCLTSDVPQVDRREAEQVV